MQPIGRRADEASTTPGLVLLYADGIHLVPAAIPFTQGTIVIGREPPPGNVRLALSSVSRVHARIAGAGSRWTIADVGSRNGTHVNGLPIKERELDEGDVVRIGDTLFEYVGANASSYAAYRPDGTMVPPAARLAPELAGDVVGGFVMDRLAADLSVVARTPLPILLLGETGTGKEVFARAAHRASGRAGAFVALNCAAIPPALIEGELFGHRRGAFTGAERDRAGHIASADGGTLFLDEIGDMPLEAQAKLLRTLETREVVPLGASAPQKVDLRLLSATHRDLAQRVAEGTFRADLFARIAGHCLELPPLREHKEDIYALSRRYLEDGPPPTFGFYAALMLYDWPFNVRELVTTMKRARALAGARSPGIDELPDAIRAVVERAAEAPARDDPPTREELLELLAKHDGNLAAVARAVRRDRALVHRWLKRFGIDVAAYRR